MMKTLFISIFVIVVLAFTNEDKLTGRWETKPSENGNITGLLFKTDNTFEGYVNKKPFVSSIYALQGDTLSIVDNSCEGKKGIYKIIFFNNSDSMRWTPISDSCAERREGIQKLVFGRVKK